MEKPQEKPHKFDIGEGYGIWEMDGETHRSFPDVFYRAKPGDSAGKYTIGDMAVMNQPTTKKRFGMFVIANVESGDFGGTGLKYKLTVHPYGTPEEISGPKPAAPIQQADNSKEKEPKMKRPTYKMQRIKLADCKPHADAEAYSASTQDRAALGNSIGETGVLSPIAVVPDEDGGRDGARPSQNGQKWFVIDGIGRMNALIAAGETETDAQVFDLGDLSVAEFVVCKNAMMRKVTTGTRVMAYLKCHEREVLAAADPEKYQQRPGNGANFKSKHHAVSRETAWDKGWSAKEIAGRIGVSKQDVLAGIELLKEVGNVANVEISNSNTNDQLRTGNIGTGNISTMATFTQLDLFETMDSVMHGETPIRRWKAAASGKVSKVGGKAAADYTEIGARLMKSLVGVWQNWQTVRMARREAILADFRLALGYAPDDFRALIKDWLLLTEAELPGKGKKRR